MRIIMGKMHKDKEPAAKHERERVQERPRGTAQARQAAKPTPSALSRFSRTGSTASRAGTIPRPMPRAQKRAGKGVFILLSLAFIATALAGVREGMAAQLGAAARKAAVLSAQLTFPQGGKSVAARELQKLQALFSSGMQAGRQTASSQTAASSASSKTGAASSKAEKSTSSGKSSK